MPYEYQNPVACKRNNVLILDLDHTIIGDIREICDMENLYTRIDWSPEIRRQLFKVDENFICQELKKGLLRPGIENFINTVRKDYGDLIVVFTLSEKGWATIVMNAINLLFGYQFWSLLLSREDCKQEGYKDLGIVLDSLADLGIYRHERELKMYDDKISNGSPRLRLCPPYLYGPQVNFEDFFPLRILSRERNRWALNTFVLQIKEWGYATPHYLKLLNFTSEGIKKRQLCCPEKKDSFFKYEIIFYS